ncbi:MAG: sulfatase-like hydrolase/transferase [Planctomycetes bacterium]|nr:sulfatase-like hydrolase/transferase [Planctomycetota bacterium]
MAQQADAKSEPLRNVIFILSDDHRFDFMRFHPGCPQWLQTPAMDRMAREGVHLANAFVSTSLCSPSRASILTGQYMHHHHVVDNQHPVPPGTLFFPQTLQKAGFTTAFIGKWHMGHDSDEPRPGFDHWAGFRGQGEYNDPTLNIDGQRKQFKGYSADVLTDLALDWLKTGRAADKPFFLYLSFKAPHYPFQPAPRNQGIYHDKPIPYPPTIGRTEENYRTQPNWVRERRYSIHGIDHMETGRFDNDPVPSFDDWYHNYTEAIHTVDEEIGRVLDYLDQSGLSRSTLVIYMGDNGFHMGEHGFYDKRDAFEPSMRVPMLAWAPGHLPAGGRVEKMVQNIDIAPTILGALGVEVDEAMKFDGRSFWPLAMGQDVPDWRDHILYEYHWEWNFPATPTMFAIRTDRYKYVYYHGVWDIDSFHDLATDPDERHNLIQVPAYQDQIAKLRDQMFKELEASGALDTPVRPPYGERLDQRKLPE